MGYTDTLLDPLEKKKKTPALLLFPEPHDFHKCGCELTLGHTKTGFYIAGHVLIRHACECVFIGIEVALPNVGLWAHREPFSQ